ncbi:MAG TPA: pyridoxamine 5'-phosphate oxidase family protein [Propionicimonas sp.]|nr:pyridoxamine 5'-phosphate oxidase family protein [Propionicimonas sp.]HRA05901.1 pyridoxamine 5'-phosphate oxidase family protein [Propionicimonas sp.]
MDTAGHFTRPSGEECRQLVRSHSVGRVAWVSTVGLQVLPVTYSCNDDLICFRVDPESVLGELAGPVEVAFEVDDIDVETATGWSVLVHGTAAAHDGSLELRLPRPWAPGDRRLTVVITPSTYSSRAVSAAVERS